MPKKKSSGSKKSLLKRPITWIVAGVLAVGAVAGGGGDKEDPRDIPTESDKSIVQVDTSDTSVAVDVSEPVVDKSEDTSVQPAEPEPQEPAASNPEPGKSQEPTEPKEPAEPKEPTNQQSQPKTKTPEKTETSASSSVATQDPPKNQSSGGGGSENNFNTYDNENQQNTEEKWVLNTSTMKIHYPSCSQVKKIAPQNYSTSSLSEEELKSQGYTTCGVCH